MNRVTPGLLLAAIAGNLAPEVLRGDRIELMPSTRIPFTHVGMRVPRSPSQRQRRKAARQRGQAL